MTREACARDLRELADKAPVAFYSSLYPSSRAPTHGVFVRELARAVAALRPVMAVAPQNGLRRLLDGRRGAAPFQDDPFPVMRPWFWTVPKILKRYDAGLMALCSKTAFAAARARGARIVHAHYAYPDAAAATLLAERWGLPCVITAHGSDINALARCPARRGLIASTLGRASFVATVSKSLAEKTAALGVEPERIIHIPNGVDISKFKPGDKASARAALDLPEKAPVILAVGRLDPVKGYDLLIQALGMLPQETRLLFAGDGALRAALVRLAGELGLSGRTRFAGAIPHEELARYYQAADVLAISSHSEGWPTIAFEAMACGLPVVAAPAGGLPEILSRQGTGLLLESNEPGELARGISRALARAWDRDALTGYASEHGWPSIAARYESLYERALSPSA